METLAAIAGRRSIRRYQERPVPEAMVEALLAAAMQAPSAGNAQPWHFVVITDRTLLGQVRQINPYAAMAGHAPLAILVCAELACERFPGNWVLDCAAAVENLLLAAQDLGLGAVWTGIYPERARMDGFRLLFGLPEGVLPHTLVPVGFPDQALPAEQRFRPERVHRDRW
ncbi:MAG: nitroreductase family protein [Thermodesulfobacteriota bacterium]